ncbi:hypothetical protein BpHYR1_029101 [Brachionus plicatilis]|uniref:Uncharacterized protein n=1 Tax=Brachionus plicatilis TaxID=10195 RepID=A0A3M7PD10_BRAPC|nr:hypothetical protein BpHYR1_029101 [Brachionus plicatilis]
MDNKKQREKRVPTCVGSFVYFEVFGAGEHFSAADERTRKGFFAGVHPDVIDELVLGLERLELAGTVLPEACVRGAVRPADMVHRQMGDDVVHGVKEAVASALGLLVDPATLELLFDGRRLFVCLEVERRCGWRRRRVLCGGLSAVIVVLVVVLLIVVVGLVVWQEGQIGVGGLESDGRRRAAG